MVKALTAFVTQRAQIMDLNITILNMIEETKDNIKRNQTIT